MQVPTGSTDESVVASRFRSAEAAARSWGATYGVVTRPGGYLHTHNELAYKRLPEIFRGKPTSVQEQILRLADNYGQYGGIRGWEHLSMILVAEEILLMKVGPRGGASWILYLPKPPAYGVEQWNQ